MLYLSAQSRNVKHVLTQELLNRKQTACHSLPILLWPKNDSKDQHWSWSSTGRRRTKSLLCCVV